MVRAGRVRVVVRSRMLSMADAVVARHDPTSGEVAVVGVVADPQHGGSEVGLGEQGSEVVAAFGINRGERFVKQQDVGLRGEATSERDSLRLTPGETFRVVIGNVAGPNSFEQGPGLAAGVGSRVPGSTQRERHVVEAGEVREQAKFLERHGDGSLVGGHESAGRRIVDG